MPIIKLVKLENSVLHEKGINQGQQDGSACKGVCGSSLVISLDSGNPCSGGRKELNPQNHLLTSAQVLCHMYHICVHVCIHIYDIYIYHAHITAKTTAKYNYTYMKCLEPAKP